MFLNKLWNRVVNIRVRLTLLYLALFGTSLIIFSLVLYDVFVESHLKEFDAALYNYAVDVLESIDISHAGDLSVSPTVDFDRGKTFPFPLGTGLMLIRTLNGSIITRYGPEDSFNPPFREDFKLLARGHDAVFRTLEKQSMGKFVEGSAHQYRLISFPIDDSPVPQIILQIAVPMTSLERQTKGLGRFFLITVPIILFLATALGYFMAGRALRPVTGIIKKASSINPQVLSDRIPLPKINDEIYQLIQTLNHMLDRIEQAFLSQERFIADASHQLLTPLATMRVELDVLNKQEGEKNFHFASFSQEIDRLSRIVKDMLLLARADAGVASLQMLKVSVTDLVFSMIQKVEKAYKEKNVRIRFTLANPESLDEPLINADPDLVELLIYNLLENAVKYTAPDSVVKVEVAHGNQAILVSVSDEGPGIPRGDHANIFERFYRSPLTSQAATGFGLGLAICKKVAQLHGATLDLDANYTQGARFVIAFPVISTNGTSG